MEGQLRQEFCWRRFREEGQRSLQRGSAQAAQSGLTVASSRQPSTHARDGDLRRDSVYWLPSTAQEEEQDGRENQQPQATGPDEASASARDTGNKAPGECARQERTCREQAEEASDVSKLFEYVPLFHCFSTSL